MMYAIAIISIITGEALAIQALIRAPHLDSLKDASPGMIFLSSAAILLAASLLLVFGYMVGYRETKNIWILLAISFASILIAEPFVAYLYFQELPTKGAAIGLGLGVVGLIATMF